MEYGFVCAAIAFSIITYYKYKAAVDRYFICVNHIVKLLMGAKKITALNIDFLGEYNDKLKEYIRGAFRYNKEVMAS